MPRREQIRRMAKLLLKLAVSVALIALLLRGQDTSALLDDLAAVRGDGLVIAVAILALLSVVQAWRWIVVLRAIGKTVSFRQSWQILMIGLFFNQTLPSAIGGDAVRMWRAYKLGIGAAPAVHSIMLDRLTALAALLVMAAVGLPVIFTLLEGNLGRWAVPAIVVAGTGGFAVLLGFDRLPSALFRWRATRALAELSADSRRLFLRARYALPSIGISIFIQVSVALVVLVLARALGAEVSWIDCLILMPPVLLISMAPISIAGWGVREGAMVTAFGLVGMAPETAFALSVLFGLVTMAVSLPGGLVWLLSGDRKTAVIDLAKDAPPAAGTGGRSPG